MKKVFVSLCMAASFIRLCHLVALDKNAATLSSLSGEWNIIEINGSAVVPAPNQEFPFIGLIRIPEKYSVTAVCNRMMGFVRCERQTRYN